jgi:hypothetical protein
MNGEEIVGWSREGELSSRAGLRLPELKTSAPSARSASVEVVQSQRPGFQMRINALLGVYMEAHKQIPDAF